MQGCYILFAKKMPLYPVISMYYNVFIYGMCEVMLHVVRCFLPTCWSFMTDGFGLKSSSIIWHQLSAFWEIQGGRQNWADKTWVTLNASWLSGVWSDYLTAAMRFVCGEQKKEGKCPTNALLVPEVRLRRAAGTTDRPAAGAFSQTKSPQNAMFTPVVSYADSLLNHLENAQ